MANVKITALPASSGLSATDVFPYDDISGSDTEKATASQIRAFIGTGLNNAALAQVTGAYSADTYLTGSSVTIPTAGGWVAGSFYRCTFDMVKTAAGTATPIITVRMGTLATTGDAAITTATFGAGTAAIDNGVFTVICVFRSVGAGTAAVLRASASLVHNGANVGLSSTNSTGGTSAGFNSTTQTVIGLSFNGGASFSGTSEIVVPTLDKYQ